MIHKSKIDSVAEQKNQTQRG